MWELSEHIPVPIREYPTELRPDGATVFPPANIRVSDPWESVPEDKLSDSPSGRNLYGSAFRYCIWCSRALRLVAEGDTTRITELWFHEQVRVMFTNALRIGDHVYASSGDFGPVPLVAVDVETGAVAWRDRSFGRLNLVKLGNRGLVLDEKGALGLVSLSPQGLTVQSRVQLRDDLARTAPSVSDGRAYLRTRSEIIALEPR